MSNPGFSTRLTWAKTMLVAQGLIATLLRRDRLCLTATKISIICFPELAVLLLQIAEGKLRNVLLKLGRIDALWR